ncbi:MAG: hypothetical protein ACI82Z_000696, partial [Cellvibrionaceae bacterium]
STAKPFSSSVHFRRAIKGSQPEVLTDIYQEAANIVIWQRRLANKLTEAANVILLTNPALQTSVIVSPQEANAAVKKALGSSPFAASLSENIAELVDMFCCLFDLKRAGLRLTALVHPICLRFHVDRVPCRLVTTYQGVGTEWLPHLAADRSKLGAGNLGKPDEQSGLFESATDIRHLSQGDVALLKGEFWHENEGA